MYTCDTIISGANATRIKVTLFPKSVYTILGVRVGRLRSLFFLPYVANKTTIYFLARKNRQKYGKYPPFTNRNTVFACVYSGNILIFRYFRMIKTQKNDIFNSCRTHF